MAMRNATIHFSGVLILTLAGAACGDDPLASNTNREAPKPPAEAKTPNPTPLGSGAGTGATGGEIYTPGFFRDLHALVDAQRPLDAAEAVRRYRLEIAQRIEMRGELPPMSAKAERSREALLVFAYRVIQASEENPALARLAARGVLEQLLGLDPAIVAMELENAVTTGTSVQSFAETALGVIEVLGTSSVCTGVAAATVHSTFDPGLMEPHWVNGRCEPDRWIEGYCEADRIIPRTCTNRYVETGCNNGYWRDFGYYEYRDGRYVWRPYWRYFEGSCNSGYYEQICQPERFIQGFCYPGYWIDGFCVNGHYEFYFPGGSWVFSNATAPTECTSYRPSQYAVAVSALEVVAEYFEEDLEAEAASAVRALLDQESMLVDPDEAYFSAIIRVFGNIRGQFGLN